MVQNTNETLQTFEVYRDGILDEELTNTGPTLTDHVLDGLQGAVAAVKLQTRMFVYDSLHHTNFRAIRHDLVRKQKEAQFVESIGLVATSKEKV